MAKAKSPFKTLRIREDDFSNILWHVAKFASLLEADVVQSAKDYVCLSRKDVKADDLLTYWFTEKRVDVSFMDLTDKEYWAVYGYCKASDLEVCELFPETFFQSKEPVPVTV